MYEVWLILFLIAILETATAGVPSSEYQLADVCSIYEPPRVSSCRFVPEQNYSPWWCASFSYGMPNSMRSEWPSVVAPDRGQCFYWNIQFSDGRWQLFDFCRCVGNTSEFSFRTRSRDPGLLRGFPCNHDVADVNNVTHLTALVRRAHSPVHDTVRVDLEPEDGT